MAIYYTRVRKRNSTNELTHCPLNPSLDFNKKCETSDCALYVDASYVDEQANFGDGEMVEAGFCGLINNVTFIREGNQ